MGYGGSDIIGIAVAGYHNKYHGLTDSSLNIDEHLLGWNVPPEHANFMHPYWKGFPAPPKYWHMIVALVYLMLFVVSWVGNGCVVWIFSTSKSLKTPSNFFIINLALFDLLMTQNHFMLILNSFSEHMTGWKIGCDIFAAFGSVAGIGSAVTNAAIAYDRYRTISSPIDGRLNGKQALVIVLITWFWSAPFTILPFIEVWGRFAPEGFLTTCSFDFLTEDEDTKVFVSAIFIWSYAIPVSLILFFYMRLFKAVKRHEKMIRDQAKKMNVKSLVSNQDKERNTEMKIAKVAFVIFFLFLCSWTPYAFMALSGTFGNREIITPYSSMIPAICAKIVSCLDPWVYAINHPRYRQELSKRCKWMGIHEPDTQSKVTENASITTEGVKSDGA